MKKRRVESSFLRALFLLIISSTVPAFSFDMDPGIATGTDPADLNENAKRIYFSIDKYSDDGFDFLHAESDYHAVAKLDLNSLAVMLSKYDDNESIFSRIIDTEDLEPEKDLTVPHRQRVHNAAKFLGIGEEYIYITVIAVEKWNEDEFVMHWDLTECELGNFIGHEGYWYLKRLDPVGNKPRTYVRMKAETLFKDPIPFQETVMNLFTDSETKKVFKELYRASK